MCVPISLFMLPFGNGANDSNSAVDDDELPLSGCQAPTHTLTHTGIRAINTASISRAAELKITVHVANL